MLTHAKRDVAALLCAGGLSMLLLAGCSGSDPEASTAANTAESDKSAEATIAPVAKQSELKEEASSKKDTTSIDSLTKLVNDNPAKPAVKDSATKTEATKKPDAAELARKKREMAAQMAKARNASEGGFIVTAEPTTLELGDIPLNEAKTGIIRLTNTGDTVMTINQCKSSCGCTAAKCPEGMALQPGEFTEVEIRMSGGTSARQISKKVTFIIDGQDPMVVPVIGNAVAFIEAVPERIAVDEMIGRPFVLRAVDGQAFTITRMVPAIATEFSPEPSTEHTLDIDWSRWDEVAGNRRRLTIYTDHPKSNRVSVFVRPSAQSIKTATDKRIQDDIAKNRDLKEKLLEDAQRRDKATTQATGDPASLLALGNYDAFLKGLEAGEFDVNARDRKNTPLINLAAEKDAKEVVEALLNAGASIESRDRIGATPLMAAAKLGSAELVQFLIDSGANIKATDVIQNTAISWAAGFGQPESVRVLLDAGADLEVSGGPVGFTPLIWAAGYGDPESVAILIDAGANVNARDTAQGATALMHAARTSKIDSLKLLLEHGADLELKTHGGKTALLLAAESSGANVEVVRMLVEAGADVTATDPSGRNALALVKNRTDPRAAAVQAYLEMVIKTDEE